MNKLYPYIILIALSIFIIGCAEDNSLEEPFIENLDGEYPDGTVAPNPYWGWVTTFPGFVPVANERINATISIASTTPETGSYWQSSGYYVAPAEKVIVTVPTGINNLKYRIGGFNDVLSTSDNNRYPDMDIEGDLTPGENEIFSYFGGHLYFYYDGAGSTTTVQANGVAKSPDFILGQTNNSSWLEEVKTTTMPWGELRADNIILTLPLELLQTIENVEEFLTFYNTMIEQDYLNLYQIEKLLAPVRLRTDDNLTASSFSNSIGAATYPVVLLSQADSVITGLVNLNSIDNTVIVSQALAMAFLPEKAKVDELTGGFAQLPYHQMYHRQGIWPQYNSNFSSVVNSFVNSQDIARRYVNLSTENRGAMLIQLAQEYGWGIFPYIFKSIETDEDVKDNQDVIDFFAMHATEYANANLIPFFEDWGMIISNYATRYMAQFPTISTPFWKNFEEKTAGFTPRTPVTYPRNPIPSYTKADRSQWTASSSTTIAGEVIENLHYEGDSTSIGHFNLMFDGDATTLWHSLWENEGVHYPHAIDIDMANPTTFNYLYWTHRNTTSNQNKCRRFQVYYKNNSGEWISLENGKVFTLNTVTTEQRVFLSNTYTATELKLILLSPHPSSGDSFNDDDGQYISVSIAEFGVGVL